MNTQKIEELSMELAEAASNVNLNVANLRNLVGCLKDAIKEKEVSPEEMNLPHLWTDVESAFKSGKTIQMHHVMWANDTWSDFKSDTPNFHSKNVRWRVRPEPAPVDKWAAEKQAFKDGRPVECRDRWSGGNWTGWRPLGGNPSWITTGEVEYRVAPAPDPLARELVPLEAKDVPPGSALRSTRWDGWCLIIGVAKNGLSRMAGDTNHFMTFKELAGDDCWKILRPGQTDWQPCSKEAKQ